MKYKMKKNVIRWCGQALLGSFHFIISQVLPTVTNDFLFHFLLSLLWNQTFILFPYVWFQMKERKEMGFPVNSRILFLSFRRVLDCQPQADALVERKKIVRPGISPCISTGIHPRSLPCVHIEGARVELSLSTLWTQEKEIIMRMDSSFPLSFPL